MQAPYADFDLELRLLLQAVYEKYQHDFRGYAASTLRRRVQQAMSKLDCATVSRLQERILHEQGAFAELLLLLTVQVSSMFRDPPYFRALREQVLPALTTWPVVRVWVAGCSSGEELWSLAILFTEAGLIDRTIFYATDINPVALRQAKAGVYALDRAAEFSRNYLAAGGTRSLSDYYVCAYDRVSFRSALPCEVVFADHSLATDSAFAEVQLVSCRNVLIYFDRPLQERAIGLFAEALSHGGYLGLGSKETLRFSDAGRAHFDEMLPGERIYRRNSRRGTQ